MLHLLTVAYAQFLTKVKVEEAVHRSIADWRGFQEVEAPRFPDIWHMKLFKLSALWTLHVSPQEIFLVLTFARSEFNPVP
jgi:hypothetical protein